jgi:hypothetical protein
MARRIFLITFCLLIAIACASRSIAEFLARDLRRYLHLSRTKISAPVYERALLHAQQKAPAMPKQTGAGH